MVIVVYHSWMEERMHLDDLGWMAQNTGIADFGSPSFSFTRQISQTEEQIHKHQLELHYSNDGL